MKDMAALPAENRCDWQSIPSANRTGAWRPSISEDNHKGQLARRVVVKVRFEQRLPTITPFD